jgi:hypothetical protein
MNGSSYFFFGAESAYAVAQAAVQRVAGADAVPATKTYTLSQLGLMGEQKEQSSRLLFLHSGLLEVALLIQGTLENQLVAAEQVVVLPPAFYRLTLFEAVIRRPSHRPSLLLSPARLSTNGALGVPPSSLPS